ncbi:MULTISPECIES: hypothetical protein [unclassified Pseudofrankia]|nr:MULTISPECIES: hypothetical protein [unclassified Pseudofrankia]MDT3445913.1 hypothetical protein [Pseudofrankia sp. BMG5.37]
MTDVARAEAERADEAVGWPDDTVGAAVETPAGQGARGSVPAHE